MDEQSVQPTPESPAAQPPEIASSDRRRRAKEMLHSQRSQLDQLEQALAERLQSLSEEVSREATKNAGADDQSAEKPAVTPSGASQLQELTAQLASSRNELRRLGEEYERHRIEAGRFEQELRIRDKLLADSSGREEARHLELAATTERLNHAQADLAAVRKQLEHLRQELEAARAECVSQSERLKELSQVAKRLAESQAECESLAGQLKTLAAEQKLATETHRLELSELRDALEAAQRDHQRAAESSQAKHDAEDREAIAGLKKECDSLTKKLHDAEAQLKKAANSETDTRKKDDLQRRFELAVEDLRETKRLNNELEAKLAKAKSGAPVASGGGLDWEAQKRRLLESLEADDGDEISADDRITIEGTIRITDQIVAQKDAEIAELTRRLEGMGPGSASPELSAAELASLLDGDEVIRQERERLQLAETEWREKIGRAEIDISVERAKIARERAELEERGRQYQAQQDVQGKQGETPEQGKAARGRWLARLGLKDLDDKG